MLEQVFYASQVHLGRFGLGEVQHLTFCYRGIEAQEKPRFGNGVPNLQRREGLWLCYRIALRTLPEGYNSGTMGVGSPRMIPKENSTNRGVVGGAYSAAWWWYVVLLLPTDCSRDSWWMVAIMLRYDAHLSASSHLFGMSGLWKDRGQRELARNS
ncbi:hypothetical protein EVAR_101592_1 [Eumeta japonica]|uniref:Uncharacterized protein n=1 Tax=Eumeta variegata TaxID=151549 RepID=A0A4C1SW51_EUMVA|nr:hypothetical protein EVAR_101592_1 [Eumeta japonica]